MKTKKEKIRLLLFDTYIATIKNGAGTKMFTQCFACIDGKKQNIAQGGELSCALFASSVLAMFNLVKSRHATVEGMLRGMKASGWKQIKKPKTGAVIVWDISAESYGHKHIGFYIGNSKAISNSTAQKAPARHHWTFGTRGGKPKRRAQSIWWHKKLDIVDKLR